MIEVKGLTKRYGKTYAIKNLSFSVKEGEVVGLLGPNGAGKTTTIRIIVGYSAASDGDVYLNGVDLLENPIQAKRNIGYLPEVPPLYPDLTILEYLHFVCKLKNIKSQERQSAIDLVLNDLNIVDVKNRLIGNLSKGYRQRVGFAQALIGNPPIIVLDEPSVGLDPKQIIEIRKLIQELKRRKHTIIISSHILSEMSSICDKLIILNRGEIVAEDSPNNLSKQLVLSSRLQVILEGDKSVIEDSAIRLLKIKPNKMDYDEVLKTYHLVFEDVGDVELRRDIFKICSNLNVPILLMAPQELSLEEIFLEFTNDRLES